MAYRPHHVAGSGEDRKLERQESRTLSIMTRQSSDEDLPMKIGWPKEYGCPEVQESDGSFFESFTALSWKQENRKRRAASEDEKEAGRPPPPESHYGPRLKPLQLNRKEFEGLYIEVLYTIKHKIGTTSGSHLPFIQDLYLYARESFGVTPEDHARLLAKASEEKPPVLILNMTVLEAKNLEAKDADGFSDPYCMLGIMPGNRVLRERADRNSGSVSSDEESRPKKDSALKRFSQSLKRKRDKTARDLIPARFIRTTTVKNNTLNPVWNEKFRCDLDDVRTDRLHLDIWDHDDEFSVRDAAKRLNEVQGLKGLGRYFKQIAQSARSSSKGNVDDFLGAVNIPLSDIPSTGVDRTYDLEGRSSRSNVEGMIRLRLSLATREDRPGYSEEDRLTEIREHEDLMCIFIEYEIRKFRGDIYKWRGELSQAAITILHQHAIQGDITETQQAMCRWAAFSRKHREHSFDWRVLLRLLDDLDNKWRPDSLSKDEEEDLTDYFQDFIHYCLNLIGRQREVYPAANPASQQRLELMLRCLYKVYDMELFSRCSPFHKELQLEIVAVLKKSTTDWYERTRSLTQTPTDEDPINRLIKLTNRFNTDLQKTINYYNPLFIKAVNVNYFLVVYKQLENLLRQDVEIALQEELGNDLSVELRQVSFDVPEVEDEDMAEKVTAQEMGMPLFELYLALNEFCSFQDDLPSSERKHLTITQYYSWFKVPLQRWLNMSKHKTLRRIKKAVELDKVASGQVDGQVKQSTSAVDVSCCFGQVVQFWKSIDWPDYVGALPFILKMTEDLCDGATYYADLIHEKLKRAGYYDECGQFDVTEQLCMTINDIEQVRRALRPLPDALKFHEVTLAVEKHNGERAAKSARASLYHILQTADDKMVQKIKQVVDRVADKMRPDIKKDVFHLCWAPEKVRAEDAIGDLMNYLDSNLVTLNTNLLRVNFNRILASIWVEVLEEIKEVLDTEEVKASWFSERLFDALAILVEFFNANDKGLPLAVIRNRYYEALHRQLSLNKSDTAGVFEIYYLEMITEQDHYDGNAFGTISVRVYYNVDAEILSVEILNAKNVIPLDPNGLSDPFVLIELCPHHVFPKQTVQQTQIVKNTLHPTFDESFEFCVTAEQCRHKGACILFTVMDHDFMLTNDFAGEAYLPLNNIPGISGEEISGFSALTPISLSLTQPKRGVESNARIALKALELRDWDKEAQDFVKKRKHVEAQSKS